MSHYIVPFGAEFSGEGFDHLFALPIAFSEFYFGEAMPLSTEYCFGDTKRFDLAWIM